MITGLVWEDANGNGIVDLGTDKIWGPTSATCATDKSSVLSVESNVYNDSGDEVMTIAPFKCTRPGFPLDGHPSYRTIDAHIASQRFVFNLTPPANYQCSDVTWKFLNCNDKSCSNVTISNGTGCNPTITNFTVGRIHYLHWKIAISIPRIVTGKIQEVNPGDASCTFQKNLTTSGLTAALSYESGGNGISVGSPAAVNGTDGTFTVTPLYDNNVFNKLCINGTVASGGVNYQLACVSSPQLTCSVGSGACAINCTPNNALSAGNVSINVGFKKPAPVLRVVTGSIYKVTPGDTTCAFQGNIPTSGVTAELVYGSSSQGTPGAVNETIGIFTIYSASDTIFNKLCINGTINSADTTYDLSCVKSPQLTCVPGTVGLRPCAVSCTPINALSTDNVSVSLGFKATPVIRAVKGSIYEVEPGAAGCTARGTIKTNGVTAALYNNASAVGSAASVNGINGTFNITPLYRSDIFNSLCINGTIDSADNNYELACVKSPQLTCSVGPGACAINCTPTNKLDAGDVNISVGFKTLPHAKWFTAIDGDIYASSVSTAVASKPLGGFSPNLIMAMTTPTGGYAFAASTINTTNPHTGISEKGGDAQRLSTLPTHPFEDTWLNKFSFVAPSGAVTTPPNLTSSAANFVTGTVYNLTAAQFNSILAKSSYSVTDDGLPPEEPPVPPTPKFGGILTPGEGKASIPKKKTSLAPKVAIVYISDSADISINSKFTSAAPFGMLVLVTKGKVVVSPTIAAGPPYTPASQAQIDLYVLTPKNIEIASKYNQANGIVDNRLVVGGGLVSRSAVKLMRNLGSTVNRSYPSEVIQFYPYLSSLITQYELAGKTAPYTGLTTFDVQFDYSQ